MSAEPTTAEKIRKLPWSIGMNALNSIFVQFTFFGSVFVLFLSELGLNKSQIGFFLSFIPYAGLIALFIAPKVARFGYKRTFLTFFGIRKLVTALLLLTPLVMTQFGPQVAIYFVGGVVLLFALFRAIAETGNFPWVQEYVPNSVRGKFSASNNIFATLTGLAAISVAGFVIDQTEGLSGYMMLIGAGVAAGLVAVWVGSHIPGGAPAPIKGDGRSAVKNLMITLKDQDFLRYLFGAGLVTLAVTPMGSFVPLFMQEQIGLVSGHVVLLQNGTLIGGLLSTYLWGWAADRYGSKPIMLSGLTLMILLPISWMLMPRNSPASLQIALGIAVLQGIGNMGWVIGTTRLLFVSIVPAQHKSEYMALYYAWVGVVGGTSQLLGGLIVQLSSGLSGRFLLFSFDPYTPLFVVGIVLPIVSALLLRGVRSDSGLTVTEFAGLFLRGNPLTAMTSLVGYHLAKDERATVTATARLGETRSLLAVEELLETLADPRFNVRFEAIISIARTAPDPRLTAALVEILHGTELALSVVAAWALGRIGDPDAYEALCKGLDSRYHSIQAHSARALGALGNPEIGPELLKRLQLEKDKGLVMAYASALGNLTMVEATQPLLNLLRSTRNRGARMELALSLARIVGEEGNFIQLLRQARDDTATATAQAATALKRKVDREMPQREALLETMTACADALARERFDSGLAELERLVAQVSVDDLSLPARLILTDCATHFKKYDPSRLEYLLLWLHTLQVGWQSEQAPSLVGQVTGLVRR